MMNYTIKQNVAVVRPDYPLSDGQDAAKLINAVRFQTGCTAMLMDRSSFVPELFTLSSGVAEQVLKPFTQNKMRLAIVGDFYDCYQTSMLYLWLQPGRPGGFLGERAGGSGLADPEALRWS